MHFHLMCRCRWRPLPSSMHYDFAWNEGCFAFFHWNIENCREKKNNWFYFMPILFGRSSILSIDAFPKMCVWDFIVIFQMHFCIIIEYWFKDSNTQSLHVHWMSHIQMYCLRAVVDYAPDNFQPLYIWFRFWLTKTVLQIEKWFFFFIFAKKNIHFNKIKLLRMKSQLTKRYDR